MMAATSHRGRTSRLAIITFVVLLSFAPVRAHAADGFFGNLWCDITGFFGFACEEVPAPTTLAPGDVRVTSTLPPPLEEKDQWTESTTSEGRVVYTTVIEEHNHYTTNPTTIIRQGGGGGSSGNWDGVSLELFHKQVDRIYDSMGNAADGLQESIAEAFTTAVLTVTGNASVGGDLNVTGTLTAGSLSVTSVSSGGAVEAPYFTATSSTASTFPYASTTAISSSYASSTNGFFGNLSIGSLSGVLKATAGAISAAAVNLASEVSGVLAVANGGTGWASIASGFIPYGNGGSALATSTALSFDGTKFTTTYASTTAFTVSGSTYLATSGGNVGIGTTSPVARLEVVTTSDTTSGQPGVYGGGFFTVGNGNAGSVYTSYNQSTNTGFIGALSPGVAWRKLVLQAGGGNVGIGTTDPTEKFQIQASSPFISIVDSSGSSGGIKFEASDKSDRFLIDMDWDPNPANDLLKFKNLGGTNILTLTGAGYVGIGTTTPAQKFHVAVDSNSIQIPARFENANTGNAVETRMQIVSGTAISQFQLFGSGHATTPRLFRISGSSDGGDMRFATVGNDRLTITSTGNVGIGTTTPFANLSVAGSAGGTTNLFAVSTSTAGFATTTVAMIDANGNALLGLGGGKVGIGTMSPSYPLTVKGASASSVIAGFRSSADTLLFDVSDDVGDGYVRVRNSSGTANVQLRANGVSYLNGGNVGIGTTTPLSLLSIYGGSSSYGSINIGNNYGSGYNGIWLNGDTSTGNYNFLSSASDKNLYINRPTGSDIRLGENGSGSQLVVKTGGNVGIGSTSPRNKLEVAGGITADDNMFIGDNQRGYFIDTYGNYKYGIGKSAAGTSASLTLYSNGEKVRIQSDGNVGIGTTSPWRKLSVTGSVGFDGLTGAVGAGSLCLSANKEVTYNSGSDNCLSSTRATKHDINALDADAISLVNALQPVSFIYNGTERTRYGFIAEDTAAIDGILATYNDAGELTGIDDRSILSVVVKAFQELYTAVMSRFTAQDARFDALEERIRELEAREGINTPPPEPDSEAGDDDESANDPTDDLPDETLGGGEIPDTIDEETPVEEEQSAPDDDVVETPEPETPDDTEGSEPSPEPPPSE